jgi:hypothetical protein
MFQIVHFVDSNPIIVDPSQFNISCIEINNVFIWSFQNKTSNTVFNTASITFNQTTTFIEGNFTLSSTGTLTFVVDTSQTNSSHLNVSGCVSISGNIQLLTFNSNKTFFRKFNNSSYFIQLFTNCFNFKQSNIIKSKILQ